MIHVRPARPIDAAELASLLNAIMAQRRPPDAAPPIAKADLLDFIATIPDRAAWHLAEDDSGRALGLQVIEPHPLLPPDACDIATFTAASRAPVSIGSTLFARTRRSAKKLGYAWINATLHADNAGALAYYQSRGFERYRLDRDVSLNDGTRVDTISTRFTL